LKCSSRTLTCISYFFNIKYIQTLQHLNHVIFKIKSNSMAYKLVDRQEVCAHYELKKYEVAHDILHCQYHLKLFFIFIHSLKLLHLGPFLLLI